MGTLLALLSLSPLFGDALSFDVRRSLLQQATFSNGAGTIATFSYPAGLARLDESTLLVADAGNNAVRAITGLVYTTTSAGSGIPALADGVGTAVSFYAPNGVAALDASTVAVADSGNNVIRVLSGGLTSGASVQRLAGSSTRGPGAADGSGGTFSDPRGLCVGDGGVLVPLKRLARKWLRRK